VNPHLHINRSSRSPAKKKPGRIAMRTRQKANYNDEYTGDG
jgi:hypothetical protein